MDFSSIVFILIRKQESKLNTLIHFDSSSNVLIDYLVEFKKEIGYISP